MVEPEEVFAFHLYLINHGRQVCKAQRPRCGECVIAEGAPPGPGAAVGDRLSLPPRPDIIVTRARRPKAAAARWRSK